MFKIWRRSAAMRQPSGAERRAAMRYPCVQEVCCRPIADERARSCRAQTRDISASGIGLIVSRPLMRGTLLEIDLVEPESGEVRTMLARVVHARSLGNGQWAIGCLFASRLSPAEIHALVGGIEVS